MLIFVFLIAIVITDISVARNKLPHNCFNFSKVVTKPLNKPLPQIAGKDNGDHGKKWVDGNRVDWGAARAIIKMPIKEVYSILLNHETYKDMKKTELSVEDIKKKGYADFHRVKVKVNVFSFIYVDWVEDWGYALVDGKPNNPKKYVISYHKVSGTEHLKHQCGSIILEKKDKANTDISVYEQVKATRRSSEDTMNMALGIIRTVRETKIRRNASSDS